uniref:Methyltransferase domain-containing protein n=1 Tax=Acrobeloides nanus TaxID=290746 RepID=A0A914DB76_9BILA
MPTEFQTKLATIGAHGAVSLSIALGIKLGLFDALADVSSEEKPATPDEVALQVALKPRYVREWLCSMACAEIIEVDHTGGKFWIPIDRLSMISGPNKSYPLMQMSMIPIFGSVFEDIVKVCRNDGPYGMDYSSYSAFYESMAAISQSHHKKTLIDKYIPMIGMKEKLEEGILVLDVGCGNGFHIFELASHFSKSHFVGIDITESAIQQAEEKRKSTNVTNAEFVCLDAKELKSEWKEKFDLVLIFDACHDQCRPDLCIKEIHRVLKPDGLFAMIEIDGTSNCYTDRQEKGLTAAMFYSVSLFHCLPVGNSTPDALGLGTMWGVERGKKLLQDAGFNDIKVEKAPFFETNIAYLARK